MHALARIRAQKICRSPLQYKPLNLADCFAGKRIKNRVCILLPYHISSVRRNRLLKKRRGNSVHKEQSKRQDGRKGYPEDIRDKHPGGCAVYLEEIDNRRN